MQTNWSNILHKTLPVVIQVGDYIAKEQSRFDINRVEEKKDKSLVSYVDKQAEEQLITALSQILPQAKFLSEESYHNTRTEQELCWVIDPLDGTTNYIHHIPLFCVSVALLCEKKPVIGIIYAPQQQECFYALHDHGAFLNKQKIQSSQSNTLPQALVATGFYASQKEKHRQYLDLLNNLTFHARGFRRIGSAALSLAYVACGRFDAFFDLHLQPWDMAAGMLLVEEAHGCCTDLEKQKYNLYAHDVLAAGKIYPKILKLIRSQWTNS